MANTLNKIIHNGDEYEIPTPKTITVTLASASWSNDEITVTATGVTATNSVIVSPVPSDISDYTSAGIYCSAQGTDSLTFSCSTTPSTDIAVNVMIIN